MIYPIPVSRTAILKAIQDDNTSAAIKLLYVARDDFLRHEGAIALCDQNDPHNIRPVTTCILDLLHTRRLDHDVADTCIFKIIRVHLALHQFDAAHQMTQHIDHETHRNMARHEIQKRRRIEYIPHIVYGATTLYALFWLAKTWITAAQDAYSQK
jgi:hypothetical protein